MKYKCLVVLNERYVIIKYVKYNWMVDYLGHILVRKRTCLSELHKICLWLFRTCVGC